ncbi:MAG: sugar nucleotide-binding protein [Candidatus Tectomicrobia bacterium]|uniref:dTDP-4-dehydrorhamnose reductase n=1 Tax=Tectimicrobiota bacterium TaxID=2528274 RepID=A0A932HX51_UNCTE|nr:sugar nucleotide-binding protein [Candidatus Tectomicrobia bacterium]
MAILLLGWNSKLGSALYEKIIHSDQEIRTEGGATEGLDYAKDPPFRTLFAKHKPRWIINCNALTSHSECEHNPAKAFAANAWAPALLAKLCQEENVGLVHLSTNFVFSRPPAHGGFLTEEDPVEPFNIYGKTKAEGERLIQAVMEYSDCSYYIVRSSWLFGKGATCNQVDADLLEDMARAALPNRRVKATSFGFERLYAPTNVHELADTILQMINQTPPRGIYHAAGSLASPIGSLAQYVSEIVTEITNELVHAEIDVQPLVPNGRSQVPCNAILDCNKLRNQGIRTPRAWIEGAESYIRDVIFQLLSEEMQA